MRPHKEKYPQGLLYCPVSPHKYTHNQTESYFEKLCPQLIFTRFDWLPIIWKQFCISLNG